MRFQAPRGTHDVLPAESFRWRHLERTFGTLAEGYGYREIRTPAFEDVELFVRSSGESSEVVNKQMYDFRDKGDRHIALKPEGTAPAMRALLEAGAIAPNVVTRVWYATPIFRYERPAKGRYRQAHQVGIELVGSPSPAADAEVIELTVRFYQALGVAELRVMLNSIGRAATRAAYREALLAHVAPWLATLTDDERARALKNPLRLLDSKDEEIKAAVADAPRVLDYLEPESKAHFEELRRLLDQAEIAYEVRPEVVRGLDYYTDTVFEVVGTGPGLGAQDSLCGGGRYDNLIKDLGGPAVPSVGVAMGVERALLVMEATGVGPEEPRPPAFVVAMGVSRDAGRALARALRARGLVALEDPDARSLKSQLNQANRERCRFAVILGEEELAKGVVTVRDLDLREQLEVPHSEVAAWLESRC